MDFTEHATHDPTPAPRLLEKWRTKPVPTTLAKERLAEIKKQKQNQKCQKVVVGPSKSPKLRRNAAS